ncbi:MAG TPA: TRAM domain-containing protein [Actinomycetota bacterium]
MERRGIVLVELVRVAVVGVFTAAGYAFSREIVDEIDSSRVLLGTVLGSAIGYVVGGVLGRRIGAAVGVAERRIAALAGADLVAGAMGLVAGGLVGIVLGLPLMLVPDRVVGIAILWLVVIVSGSLGYRIAIAKREDILQLFGLTFRTRAADLRVLDTSAILNARLLDYVRAGLIRGTLLLPGFVLEEAQGIADSADHVRRRRARHGLEALAAIRREELCDVRTVEKTYPEFAEVDAKVIALARERGAAIVTDDGALAQVAELQGIEVVLLRRVATALRPAVLPGEQIRLELAREGREPGQGVGYLDDGTMVVVEQAAAEIGRHVDAVVNRIVQTPGGRMLFARLADGAVTPESAPAREEGA